MKPGDIVTLVAPWDAMHPGELMVQAVTEDGTVTVMGADFGPGNYTFVREGELPVLPPEQIVEIVIGGIAVPVSAQTANQLILALQTALQPQE